MPNKIPRTWKEDEAACSINQVKILNMKAKNPKSNKKAYRFVRSRGIRRSAQLKSLLPNRSQAQRILRKVHRSKAQRELTLQYRSQFMREIKGKRFFILEKLERLKRCLLNPKPNISQKLNALGKVLILGIKAVSSDSFKHRIIEEAARCKDQELK